MNLLSETISAIAESGHEVSDIVFIGSTTGPVAYSCTWDEYARLANFDYDNGYGGAHIAQDLRIVFADGADMHRGEYDGSEWWEFSKPFVAPAETRKIRLLGGEGHLWASLHEINAPDE